MPRLVAAAVDEMWNASNMAFELCPMLTAGAIEAIERNGSDELKQLYLPKMVAGEWTGTMNLTEPQAGSDLAAVRTRAVPQADGTYKLYGSKIFITYGEHDLHGQHRAPRARAHAGRAGRDQGHLALRRSQVPGERRRQPRRAQRRPLRVARAQARHPREPDGGARVRRPRGRHRPHRRRGEPRPRIHVRDDEPRAFRRRDAGRGSRGSRVPARGDVCARARAGPRRRARRRMPARRASSAIPTCGGCCSRCAPARGGACAGLRDGGGARSRAPAPGRRSPRARARVRRADDPHRQGLEHRDGAARRVARRAGSRRHGLHRGIRRGAVSARRADHDDLRRHDGHPGQRPHRPQDRARRRQGAGRRDRGDARHRTQARSIPDRTSSR